MKIEQNSVVGGRYRLIRIIESSDFKEMWLAHDMQDDLDTVIQFDLSVLPKVVLTPSSSESDCQKPLKDVPVAHQPKSNSDIHVRNVDPTVHPSASHSSDPLLETFTVKGVSFKMIAVQGGTFQMGATPEQDSDADSDEDPVHGVTLSSFRIGETEVTQELWQAVMGSNPSYHTSNGLQCPVEQVSWDDCQSFISKLNQLTGKNFRLPTEAEWEFAARGGNKSRGYKYSGSDNLGSVAWYDGNSGDRTHAVKTKSPNELGIYDMSGNVWEWCSDWYRDTYPSGSVTNPKGPSSGEYRVPRGGSCYSSAVNCRVSNRFSLSLRFNILGLRLAI